MASHSHSLALKVLDMIGCGWISEAPDSNISSKSQVWSISRFYPDKFPRGCSIVYMNCRAVNQTVSDASAVQLFVSQPGKCHPNYWTQSYIPRHMNWLKFGQAQQPHNRGQSVKSVILKTQEFAARAESGTSLGTRRVKKFSSWHYMDKSTRGQ